MKPFNLKEHLEHPDWKVVTRDGHPARIICTDRKGSDQPILALVQVRADPIEVALTFGADGTYDIGRKSCYDLFLAPEKHEGWVNIYQDFGLGIRNCKCIFDSKEEALRNSDKKAIATVKIEWEEKQ